LRYGSQHPLLNLEIAASQGRWQIWVDEAKGFLVAPLPDISLGFQQAKFPAPSRNFFGQPGARLPGSRDRG